MARAIAEVEEETQGDLWPELDRGNPTHKAVLAAAKKYAREKAARDEVLSTCKEKVDGCMSKLIDLMHDAKLDKFKFEGVKVELIPGKEKARVRLNDDQAEEDGEED